MPSDNNINNNCVLPNRTALYAILKLVNFCILSLLFRYPTSEF